MENCNRNESKDFSLCLFRILAVFKGQRIHGMVQIGKLGHQKKMQMRTSFASKKNCTAKAVIVTAIGKELLRAFQNAKSPENL